MSVRRQRVDFTGSDEVAIGLSTCCLLHCVAWPFLLANVPGVLDPSSGLLHQMLGAISVFVSLIVLGIGYDFHHTRSPVALGICGIVLLTINIVLPLECCSAVTAWASGRLSFSEIKFVNWGAFLIAPVGAVLLISAHTSNRRLLKKRCAKRTDR